MNVRIVNIRHGKGERNHIIYADMVDDDTGMTSICATLFYILDAIEQRGHIIVGDKK